MTLEILTPEKKVYSGEADAVQFPGAAGSFQILNNHAPLISSLTEGKIKIDLKRDSKTYNITGGFVEVLKNKVTVLVEGVKE